MSNRGADAQRSSSFSSLLINEQPGDAPYDLWHRYYQAARLIDQICGSSESFIKVLDVGCNVATLLSEMLDPARVQIVRADVIAGPPDDPDYIPLQPDAPLPVENGSFDVVLALEVVEHVPRDRRRDFVADLVRVARQAVVISCPVASRAVAEAERLVNDAYQLRHGAPHPFLQEHLELGVPTADELRDLLHQIGRPYQIYPGLSVERWLAANLLSEGLLELSQGMRLQKELANSFQATESDIASNPYRQMVVIAANRHTLDKLEPPPRVDWTNESNLPTVINDVCHVAARTLIEHDNVNHHLPAVLRSVIKEQENGLFLQEQRFQILRGFADALTTSTSWRLLAPLRWMKHLIRPRGFNHSHLIPFRDLEPTEEPNGWTALSDDPQFLVSCYLPAGWLRIRLQCRSSVKTQMDVYAERRGGFGADSILGQFTIVEGENNEEFFVHLDQPTRALRVDPLSSPGVITFQRFEVTPRPAPHAVMDALRRKLRLLRAYHNTGVVLRRGLGMLLTGRWRQVREKWALGLSDPRCTRHGFYEPEKAYEKWIERHRMTDEDRAKQGAWADELKDPPVISVLLPTYNTPERYLRLALDSVCRQTYPHWELCIADDGSTQPHVREILQDYAARDVRIRLAPPGRHGGISRATNAALDLANGDFVALFDHDDEIAEHALYALARAAIEQPQADVLYSDEDKIQPDGKRVTPFFKPDWSPEFFLGCMYTCHLSLYRTSLVREVGGFRPEFDSAQDYDLALRVIEKARQVVHVPDVLYHWRLLPNSTASGVAAKPHAHAAALRALEEHLQRTERPGYAQVGPSAGLSFVRFAIRGTPTVSIIIPSLCKTEPAPDRPTGFLENCLASIKRLSTWRHYEVIVLDRHTMPRNLERRLIANNVRRIAYDHAFNWSKVNNLGAAHATGDYLLFLNDDTEIISPDWLQALLEFAQQKEIGAVGAKLFFPSGSLQHVGVTVLDGKPGHPFYGYPGQHPGYFCRNQLPHNTAAVTGACLMTRAEVFHDLGGFDESFPLNYNDVDYCFRLRRQGYRIVFTPHAQLRHFESVTKPGVFAEELQAFQKRWGDRATDPFYNPNLNMETFDYRIGT
jgi:GT2 family glycosyltransferase